LRDALCQHPLFTGLTHNRVGPSYVAKATFALTLIDVIMANAGKPTEGAKIGDLRAAVRSLSEPTRGALSAILDETVNDIAAARKAIEQWFDSGMDRVSGVYKRRNQLIIVAWAVGLTVVANADSIAMTKALANDPALRAQVVDEATKKLEKASKKPEANAAPSSSSSPSAPSSKDTGSTDLASKLREAQPTAEEISSLELPLGWRRDSIPTDALSWLLKLLGFLFTSVAVSLGAPFWFDMLNRVVNLRTSGRPPDRDDDKADTD
jgi:hypothetical protein